MQHLQSYIIKSGTQRRERAPIEKYEQEEKLKAFLKSFFLPRRRIIRKERLRHRRALT